MSAPVSAHDLDRLAEALAQLLMAWWQAHRQQEPTDGTSRDFGERPPRDDSGRAP